MPTVVIPTVDLSKHQESLKNVSVASALGPTLLASTRRLGGNRGKKAYKQACNAYTRSSQPQTLSVASLSSLSLQLALPSTFSIYAASSLAQASIPSSSSSTSASASASSSSAINISKAATKTFRRHHQMYEKQNNLDHHDNHAEAKRVSTVQTVSPQMDRMASLRDKEHTSVVLNTSPAAQPIYEGLSPNRPDHPHHPEEGEKTEKSESGSASLASASDRANVGTAQEDLEMTESLLKHQLSFSTEKYTLEAETHFTDQLVFGVEVNHPNNPYVRSKTLFIIHIHIHIHMHIYIFTPASHARSLTRGALFIHLVS